MPLTKEIQNRVYAKVVETVDKLNAHFKIGMPVPAIFYDVRGIKGGVAKYPAMTVHFNPKLLEQELEDFLKRTVPHEVCHIGQWQKALKEKKNPHSKPHGSQWKLMMWIVGAQPRRTHSYNVEEVKKNITEYSYQCGCLTTRTVSAIIHNRIIKGRSYQCKQCKHKLHSGQRILKLGFSKPSPYNTTKVRQND